MKPTSALLLALALIALLSTAGCTNVSPVGDDSYLVSAGVDGQWQVWYNSPASVQSSSDGTVVSVYCRPEDQVNVKVSGVRKFQVHSCYHVVVDKGTTAEVYSANLVKARSNSTVSAYDCYSVNALADANVTPYASTRVHRVQDTTSK